MDCFSWVLLLGVDKVGPAENQYALQHVTLFATHNLIFHSPWLTNTIFYVDECWNVYKATASPLVSLACFSISVAITMEI